MQTVLTKTQIDQKITRLAHQVLENAYNEQTIYLAGICGNGIRIAHKIKSIIENQTSAVIEVFEITLDKHFPLEHPISAGIDTKNLMGAYIILIDDVLNSGRTMQYALFKLLESRVKSIKTLALVDRHHHLFPIKCDYAGILLSTTLKDRVEINFDEEEYSAKLV